MRNQNGFIALRTDGSLRNRSIERTRRNREVGGRMVGEYLPTGDKYYYYASDQINSTRLVVDAAGKVVHSAQYDPFGGLYKTWADTYHPKPGFSGKERECLTLPHVFLQKNVLSLLPQIRSEFALDSFGARYYGHAQYRFLSVDPIINKEEAITNPQLWNLYAYCRNNPIIYLDPDGKDAILGIHTNALPTASYGAGHAWISITNIETMKYKTYGIFCESGKNDMSIDWEHDWYKAKYSRFYYLDNEQEKKLLDIVSRETNWTIAYNCADWASDVILKVVGEFIDAEPSFIFNLPWGSPSKIARSIIELEKKQKSSKSRPIHYNKKKEKDK